MRILLVDEQALFLDSLKGALRAVDGVEFVATTSDSRAATDLYQSEKCNMCLIDVGSSRLDWVRAIEGIYRSDPRAKVAALTARVDEPLVIDAVLRGVRGFLLKQALLSELTWALQRIHIGQEVFAPEVAGILTRRLRALTNSSRVPSGKEAGNGAAWLDVLEAGSLSDREREILLYVVDGISNREIAEIVHVTEGTVKNHVSSILRKLKLSQRSELIAFAWSHGLKGSHAAASGDQA